MIVKERNVMWTAWEGVGLEHLHFIHEERGVMAEGVVLGVSDGQPFRVNYRVRCDAQWRVREVELSLLVSRWRELRLAADGNGHWTDGDGQSIAALEGCIDADLSITPFTNSLPIRRLKLKPGESGELLAAYVSAMEMKVSPSRQRYTCLQSGLYRYEDEGPYRGFSADLTVDVDGLVIDYPGLFRRLECGGEIA
jgi:uncharacterized protein